MNDPALIDEMLRKTQTIAVVGVSDKPWRASHNIARYLVMQGYRVLPVNPRIKEVHGLKCYPDLESAQEAAKSDGSSGIDLVDVFRASQHVAPIVEDTIKLGIPYIWLQEDVINDKALTRARSAGVKAVQDVCIFREHAQRVG
jgi:predicted CoA-binding protein